MRIAQILNNKVHWIFEAETLPEFAPNIVLLDITGLTPSPQEGWDYHNGTFSEPQPVNHAP